MPALGGDPTLWWKLSMIISCGTLAGAIIPELVKVFTSTESAHVREVVTSSREGGPSLNILSGLVAGNFSAYWLGISIVALMSIAYYFSTMGLDPLMVAAPVFAFGLVAFGFLGMGPVTIAVDSYGPVTDNAQSVYELSLIEAVPNVETELKKDFNINVNFARAKHLLEENDGAGNTFKATAKPVLIGTAVVGATTMIFSIIQLLRASEVTAAIAAGKTEAQGLADFFQRLSLLDPLFLLGLVTGGAVIYWFTGASTQAVTTGAYRAVEFIKANIRLEGVEKASVEDSKKVVQICTQYAQKGMFNIFLTVFFSTLAFAFVEPFFFIGDFDCDLRSVSGALLIKHRQCLGQREESRRGRPETERDRTARRNGCRRHRRRSVQRHFVGGYESSDQIHDAVWIAGGAVSRINRGSQWAVWREWSDD